MSIVAYCRRASSDLPDPQGPLSKQIPQAAIHQANANVLEVQKTAAVVKKKRGPYKMRTPGERAAIGQYAAEHRNMAAVRKFSGAEDNPLSESTVQDFKKQYLTELKRKRAETEVGDSGCSVVVNSLPPKKRGRPLLLGEDLNGKVQTYIKVLRERGAVVDTAVVIGAAKGIVEKSDRMLLSENGGPITLTKSWAASILFRMGFVKRRGTTKVHTTPADLAQLQVKFLQEIKSTVEMEEIPASLVINWDQTGLHIVPVSTWTMEKVGARRVEIVSIDDKRMITGTYVASLAGDFLPPQLIYTGKTAACHPSFEFPQEWHITHNPKHWANETTVKLYITKIIVPYIEQKINELQLSRSQRALVMFDCFRGQITQSCIDILEENNIDHVLIPPNCTDKLQPLDLSVNKSCKEFLRNSFQDWYAQKISKQLEDGDELHPVDLRMSVMKPLGARWIVSFYDYLKNNPQIVFNGFKEAGIADVLGFHL